MSARTDKVVRASARVVLLLWLLLLFLLAGNLTIEGAERKPFTISSPRNLDTFKLAGTERHAFHREPIINYVSKRRVPNGPDPIHNRRAWKLRNTPTRA